MTVGLVGVQPRYSGNRQAGDHGHREEHHGTDMDVEASYTDTHGQSIIGFGLTRLLGFDLLPRIKAINRVRLYRPGPGESYPRLAPAMAGRPTGT